MLTIAADNVTLDLNGFTVTGPGGSSGNDGVQVGNSSQTLNNDAVENGTIDGAYYDVYVGSTRHVDLTGLKLLNNGAGNHYGIYASDGVDRDRADGNSFEDFYIYGNYYDGFTLVPGLVSHNIADNNGGDGFYDVYSFGETLTGNTANGNTDYGMNLDEPVQYTVAGNTTDHNSYSGIYLEDNYSYYGTKSFAGNIAQDNQDYGIYADTAMSAAGNPGNAAVGSVPYNCFNLTCNEVPVITKVAPKTGSTKGGTLVIITGKNLLGPRPVHFGKALAKLKKVFSANKIEVAAPKGGGTVYVTVTTLGGTSAKTKADRSGRPVTRAAGAALRSSGRFVAGLWICKTGAREHRHPVAPRTYHLVR